MRQLLLERLKEESWIETVGEATQEAEIRKLVKKTAPDSVVVTAVRPDRPPAICDELLSEFLDFSAQ
jgi:AmiR/NasT family two-component response regulator